jgi:NAD(P)-dependent dehydrogenase (short-subunit alcohol dehydrogenase family)
MPEPVAGKTVVVTGGGGGLGLAIARAFGRRGAQVALLDRDEIALAEAIRDLHAEGIDATAHGVDVTDAKACESAMAAIAAQTGGIDILVNNAGISQHAPFAQTDPAVFRKVVEVNLFGSVHCTKAALESLRSRRGRIVAISSVAGFAPLLDRTGYAASKHALHGFFDTLRAELAGDGVTVTVVCPAYVDTKIDAHALAGDGGRLEKPKRVVGRVLPPEVVAEKIVDAALARKERLLVSGVAKIAWWVSRITPGLYRRMMLASHRR